MLKNILIKAEMSGRGLVNFDAFDTQRLLMKKYFNFELRNPKTNTIVENIKYAKKSIYSDGKDEYGKTIWKYKNKISSECLRQAIFGNDVDVVNGSIAYSDLILATYTLSSVGLVRGFMFPGREKTLVRKSALTITDAIQTNNEKSVIEIGSNAGERDMTSCFYTEKTGDMTYAFNGNISIKQLQFVSADPYFERMAILSDWIQKEKINVPMILKNHYGDVAKPRYGVFTSTSKFTTNVCAEYGMLLNQEWMVYLIKKTLKDMLSANIMRSNAYAKVDSIQIKLVDNIIGIGQKMNDNNGWITLKTEEDVDNLELGELQIFYTEATEDDLKTRNELKEIKAKTDKETKDRKAAEKKGGKSKPNKKEESHEIPEA